MKNYFFIILFYSILFSSCLPKQKFELQEGDFLFQDLDSSPLCDAIELVTPGYKDANFSHIGLVVLDNDKLKEIIISKINLKYSGTFTDLTYKWIEKEKKKLNKWCSDMNYRQNNS